MNNFQKAQRLQCAADDFEQRCTGDTKAVFHAVNHAFAKLDDVQLATFFDAIAPEASLDTALNREERATIARLCDWAERKSESGDDKALAEHKLERAGHNKGARILNRCYRRRARTLPSPVHRIHGR